MRPVRWRGGVYITDGSSRGPKIAARAATRSRPNFAPGVANGEWHPATSGYLASPGDVAIYGLAPGAHPSAVHVAIVTNDRPGQRGPDVVNGDGDRTGFSIVETGTDQVRADAGPDDSTLAGYVSPP